MSNATRGPDNGGRGGFAAVTLVRMLPSTLLVVIGSVAVIGGVGDPHSKPLRPARVRLTLRPKAARARAQRRRQKSPLVDPIVAPAVCSPIVGPAPAPTPSHSAWDMAASIAKPTASAARASAVARRGPGPFCLRYADTAPHGSGCSERCASDHLGCAAGEIYCERMGTICISDRCEGVCVR